ncbi:D-methionine transport system substrate-binding protein [Georgenia satyanarayanai]|uniref:Lipoprotein n=1 Tax=Georgenia satyanarayanai TaxID=860221 RepID=A0A2Y9AI35_9MICO|nr:MetQ/NlpA family ABC transporter substrate-binding protein [Georgenia satyanarayanai]PYF99028.1 D-methionine transport system substrate-binding protein [Georgenia satyanarayanai]SSA43990.1 D-methionine transport system substrate-binding protein [Georgenia satyanarayanai]
MTTARTSTRIAALAGVAALTLAACGDAADDTTDGASPAAEGEVATIVVGASPTPHAEILEFVQENLAEDAGFTLDIVEYTDYVQPNVQLAEGELDANFFQHLPYYEAEVAEKGYDFAHFEGVHIEPYGVYSDSVASLDELPDGAQVGVPNDPANQARALELLASEGLFTLAEDVEDPTIFDVAENPKNVELAELEAAQLVRSLQDFDAAVINGNYALEADLNPAEDAILLESGEGNPYANLLAVRAEDAENEAVLALDEALHSEDVRDFITERWPAGEIIPAF